jgi:peptidoglycan/xylan/chitin deacetylase (PgdA/CDA1 family)
MLSHPRPQQILPIFAILVFGLLFLFLIMIRFSEKPPEQRVVLLSFDVEMVDDPEDVIALAEVLERNGVTGTFFITGQFAEEYPETVKRLSVHEIASHSYSHPKMTRISPEEKRAEIIVSRNILEEITGKKVVGFRAPYNLLDYETISILNDEGFIYDASIITDWHIFYPIIGKGLVELPISSIIGIPMEDVVWLHYLKWIGKIPYFYILNNKNKAYESYLFHPHHIIKEKEQFESLIKHLKKSNAIFISHSQLAESHGG